MSQSFQQPDPANRKLIVMVSSTAQDLPEHRAQIKEACLRQGMFPSMMEHLPATDADAITASLHMVDEADIYLGVFAYRYGYIPREYSISITEMEYNRAIERNIPRLIFLIDEKHSITIADIEHGDGMLKLASLKARLQTERVVNYFISPIDLHARVINGLSHYRQHNPTLLHYVSDIPTPPMEYVAHPYTLLQTPSLIGRQRELNLLTDWVSNLNSELHTARILSIVGIGGMGKSALSWKWFHDIAPNEMQPLRGRLWWSFYESDSSFDHFVTRALTYISKIALENIQSLSQIERETRLLTILDQEPYLLVLDGMERILLAYARMDAARLMDDDLDQQTANFIAEEQGLPESAGQSFVGQYRLRKTTDSRIGMFLRKLSTVHASRILVSTRLYPADLQTVTGDEWPGCKALFLGGLIDDDALNLWRAFGVSGSRDTLLPLFHTFDNHPLLLQVLAGVVARHRSKPGDFDHWRKKHPAFDPFQLPLVQARSHVLAFALRGLSKAAQEVLFTIAAFRMPTSYDTLVALFVSEGKLFLHEDGLVSALTDLEDRGLLGWDRRANRYDLHPIVRGVTWSRLGKQTKRTIYENLNGYFDSLPEIDGDDVKNIEDLTAAIELYNSLVGLERYDDAYELFEDRLDADIILRLGIELRAREMLEALFPQGIDQEPFLSNSRDQAYICLFIALYSVDQATGAARWYKRGLKMLGDEDDESVNILLMEQLCLCGSLYEAEMIPTQQLPVVRDTLASATDRGTLDSGTAYESKLLTCLGLTLAARGKQSNSEKAFVRSLKLYKQDENNIEILAPHDGYSMSSLWSAQFTRAYTLAQEARILYHEEGHYTRKVLRSTWLQGMAALELNKEQEAEELFLETLRNARELSQIGEEIPIRIGLAELRRRQGDLKAAREMLDEVWEPAESGSFRLYHADAFNVLAQIERDAGHNEKAFQAATSAYRLAWCDGPPFAYDYGLQKARNHLLSLHRPEPSLPPFEVIGREPLPEVVIDPLEELRENK